MLRPGLSPRRCGARRGCVAARRRSACPRSRGVRPSWAELERLRESRRRLAATIARTRASGLRERLVEHEIEPSERHPTTLRDRMADERDQIADERERIADARDQIADARDQTADDRERDADKRDA